MNFGNCTMCNRVTSYNKVRICKECYLKYYQIVKEYLFDNDKATIEQIHENTNIPVKLIELYFNDGLLYIDEEQKEKIAKMLETKEQEIRRKKLETLNSLKRDIKDNAFNEKDKMFFLNNNSKKR